MSKVLIVLDADVIIHFAKGNLLSILPNIFAGYDYVVLDKVFQEIKGGIKVQLENQIHYFKNINVINYSPKGDELKEFAVLQKDKGKGESACLAFCRYNNNVIGSSNLKDIAEYCKVYSITYLTTIDFLYFAIQKNLITVTEANNFILEVRKQDSKLPDINMAKFKSSVLI